MLFRSSDRDEPLLSSSSLLLLPLLLLLLLLLCTRAVIPRFVLTPSLHKLLVFRSVLAAKAYRYEQENYSVSREESSSAREERSTDRTNRERSEKQKRSR